MEKFTELLLRNVPREIQCSFKAACARAGESMKASLVDYMEAIGKGELPVRRREGWDGERG